jgi:pilus assembly protein CpaB
MILRVVMLLLVASGLLGFGLVAWVSTRHPALAEAARHPAVTEVLVAAHALQPGALLKPDDLAAKKLEPASLPSGASADTQANRRDLVGAMVRRTLVAGDVIQPRDVMRPGDHGFLAAVLSPGMRAVTVGVDVVSGTAGLIWPGDRVDVNLTETIGDHAAPPGRQVAAETVLADVRVIAIDQRLVEGATPDNPAGKDARTVTLEVTAAQAERVAVAIRLGRLSLAVRAAEAGPPGVSQRAPTTWAGDVSPALAGQMTHDAPDVVRVFQGAADGKEFHF